MVTVIEKEKASAAVPQWPWEPLGFALKHLVRTIATSRAYERSSLPTPSNRDDRQKVMARRFINDKSLATIAALKDLAAEAGKANCFVAPNFAIGAVLLMEAAQLAAKHMPECEIVELHHDRKLDAPSGTAKRTEELIEAAGGNVHEPNINSLAVPGVALSLLGTAAGRPLRSRM